MTNEERYRKALELIRHRCARQEKDPALTERGRVCSFLREEEQGFRAKQYPFIADALGREIHEIEQGRHLPGGELPPADPHFMQVCAKAGIPPSMRCPSCKACDGLGVDAETGEPVGIAGPRL